MTIALARKRRFDGARYQLTGEISRNADWVQTLDLPADGATVSISGQTVSLMFREESGGASVLTITPTVSDADTISISATPATLSALEGRLYVVDLTGSVGGVTTHWAHGTVMVRDNPSD